ncbi:Adenine deaminase [Seiridium cupressi]
MGADSLQGRPVWSVLRKPQKAVGMTQTKREWLRGLPKAELHLHLEGTVTPETLVVLSERHDSTPLTLEEARALYAYDDFAHFLHVFRLVLDRLQTPEDYALISKEMMRNLHQQGVVHAEVYIAWGNILKRKTHLKVADVMAAIEDARLEVERELGGPSVLWIADAARQWGAEETGRVFRLAAELKQRFPTVVGVGIGGDEVAGPIEWFHDLYIEAKKAGLRLTAHAGEATGPVKGPLEMRAALAMGVERIGHGLAAQHDDELMAILAKRQTPIEINVTSNVFTGCCPSIEDHPLPKYLSRGLLCTLNSDDPTMFGSACLDEYVLVSEAYSLDLEKMRELARNSVYASFLPDERKAQLFLMIDAYA